MEPGRPRERALSIVVVAAGVAGFARAGSLETLDATRIAFRQDAAATPAATTGIASAGIAADAVAAWPITGWSLAETPAASRSAAGIRALAAALAADDAIAFVSPVFVDDEGGPLIVTGEILVAFVPDVTREAASEVLAEVAAGAVIETDWAGMPGVYRLRHPSDSGFDVLATAQTLAAQPEVRFAEPDMIFTGSGGLSANDPGYANCWGIHNIGQFGGTLDIDMDGAEAWDVTAGDESIRVVIIDCGVQQDHPDLNQITGADVTHQGPGDGGPVAECDHHGTIVAGCVSASMNNALGTTGIAPSSKVASVRTFITLDDCSGVWTSQTSWTVDALTWAESIGARVTANSNIYGFSSNFIAEKYMLTRAAGMVHFACAGNDLTTQITYPGSLSSVSAVAGIDNQGQLALLATTGEGLALAAPGQGIYTTDRTGADGYSADDYCFGTGCSLATPYAAGVAALVLAVDPTLAAAEVELIVLQTAMDLGAPGYDTTFGWGLVNAKSAVGVAGCPVGLTGEDINGNKVPDECECVGDFDGSNAIDVADLLAVIGNWGPCAPCPYEVISNGAVDVFDLLYVVGEYGPCP